ncbi:MAG: hypothetical protein IT176_05615 [Acidobacteria bacterium]|nr:hypothetical protein [Acidobacteriota bacterium]
MRIRSSRRPRLSGSGCCDQHNQEVVREGQWLAHAERGDTGDRFGPEFSGATEREAVDRLTRWLEWQAEHISALEALQAAERAYHRTIAGSAFASPTEGPSAAEMQKDSLNALEAARVRLDEVRARKPD